MPMIPEPKMPGSSRLREILGLVFGETPQEQIESFATPVPLMTKGASSLLRRATEIGLRRKTPGLTGLIGVDNAAQEAAVARRIERQNQAARESRKIYEGSISKDWAQRSGAGKSRGEKAELRFWIEAIADAELEAMKGPSGRAVERLPEEDLVRFLSEQRPDLVIDGLKVRKR